MCEQLRDPIIGEYDLYTLPRHNRQYCLLDSAVRPALNSTKYSGGQAERHRIAISLSNVKWALNSFCVQRWKSVNSPGVQANRVKFHIYFRGVSD